MILVLGRFEILPARRGEFLAFAADLVAQERGAAGCLHFDIAEDVTAHNTFVMIEEWASHEAMEDHGASEQADRNNATLEGFFMGEPSFDTYEF